MNFKAKHEKIMKSLSNTNFENFIEKLSSIEYILETTSNTTEKALVPMEANFQLPNTFLKSRPNFKLENLFSNSNKENNWDEALDASIAFLDEIQFDMKIEKKSVTDVELLERMICWRNGKKPN